MAFAATLEGFTRFSGATGKASGIVIEGANGSSYYVWVDNDGILRTTTAALAEAGGFDFQTGGNIIGGGAGATAIASLTGTVGGTANDAMTAVTDPADTPASADALRDDLVTNTIPTIEANFTDLQAKVNAILAALRTHGIVAT